MKIIIIKKKTKERRARKSWYGRHGAGRMEGVRRAYLDKSIGVILVQLRDGEKVVVLELELLQTRYKKVKYCSLASVDVADAGVQVVDLQRLFGSQAVEDAC